MRLKHTKDSLALAGFLSRISGWHSYSKDRKTLKAVRRCALLGCLELNEATRQFRPIN